MTTNDGINKYSTGIPGAYLGRGSARLAVHTAALKEATAEIGQPLGQALTVVVQRLSRAIGKRLGDGQSLQQNRQGTGGHLLHPDPLNSGIRGVGKPEGTCPMRSTGFPLASCCDQPSFTPRFRPGITF